MHVDDAKPKSIYLFGYVSLFLADIFKGPCTKLTDPVHCNFRVRLCHDDDFSCHV